MALSRRLIQTQEVASAQGRAQSRRGQRAKVISPSRNRLRAAKSLAPDARDWGHGPGSLSQPGWGRGSKTLSESLRNHLGHPGKVPDEGLGASLSMPDPAWQSAGTSFPPDRGGEGPVVQGFPGCSSPQRAEHFRHCIAVQKMRFEQEAPSPVLRWCELREQPCRKTFGAESPEELV